MNYLHTNVKSQGQRGCESKESRVCTGIVSTGSEGIKQCDIITIRGNRVRAGQVPILAIDMVQSVFSLGLLGLAGEVDWGVMDMMLNLVVPESDPD